MNQSLKLDTAKKRNFKINAPTQRRNYVPNASFMLTVALNPLRMRHILVETVEDDARRQVHARRIPSRQPADDGQFGLDAFRFHTVDWVGLEHRLIYLTKPCGAGLHTRSENFDARLGAGIENDGFQRAGQRFGVPKESILFTCLPFSENTCYLVF